MIRVFGTLVKIEKGESRGDGNLYQRVTILAPSRDRIYTLTDYDMVIPPDLIDKNIYVPVRVNASKTGYLNIIVEGLATILDKK